MSQPFEDIAARLLLAIEATGMTQAEFARRAGLSPRRLGNWTRGADRIGLDGALALRAAYGLPLDWVYCGGSVDKLPANVVSALRDKPRDNHST